MSRKKKDKSDNPRRHLSDEEIIDVWNSSETAEEALAKLPVKRQRSSLYIRVKLLRKLGVPMKDMRRQKHRERKEGEIEALKERARKLLEE